MGFPTKSGKSFGSAYVAKRHDQEHDKADQMSKSVMGDTPAHEEKETPEFEKGEQEGQTEKPEQEGMNESPEQVAQEHGPATTVHVAHDHKAGKHHVTSTHPDGHVHTSDHATAEEAHHAAGALSNGDQASAGNPEAQGMAPAAPESDGFSMPRLA